ncbi:MAG: sulfite exporter TauE/SafE family protein [Oscillospiraceae bacterium]|nr:sulfite exporter TauE/SafE family protein [Oscillospiraceae bacterium]
MEFHNKKQFTGAAASGLGAGILNGLFGGGGGMVLIPGLEKLSGLTGEAVFPTSVLVMLPVSVLTLFLSGPVSQLPWREAWPYLAGSAAGGILAGFFGGRIPLTWLHRGLGIMLLWGGFRYLW